MSEQERVAQFLLTLSELMPRKNITERTGKSIGEILGSSGICDGTEIRCICGVPVSDDYENMIRCSSCNHLSHRECVKGVIDPSGEFKCQICRFKKEERDPLGEFSSYLDEIKNTVMTIGSTFQQIEDVASKYHEAGMIEDCQRNEHTEKNRAKIVSNIYEVLEDAADKLMNMD